MNKSQPAETPSETPPAESAPADVAEAVHDGFEAEDVAPPTSEPILFKGIDTGLTVPTPDFARRSTKGGALWREDAG